VPTAQTAPGHPSLPIGDFPLIQDARPPDLRPVSGLWLAQQAELPGDLWLAEHPDPSGLPAPGGPL